MPLKLPFCCRVSRLLSGLVLSCFALSCLIVGSGLLESVARANRAPGATQESQGPPVQETAETPARWSAEMQQFAELDQQSPPVPGSTLFLGSSSIRLWNLSSSFPEQGFVNRGFGGSEIADSTEHFDRLVTPHQPKLIVFYAGDNDVANGLTAAEVAANFAVFAAKVHQDFPLTKIAFLSIKPSESRWKLIDEQREANRRVEAICAVDARLRYVDLASCLLGDDGRPDAKWFQEDQLHLSAAGYELWTARLKEVLRELK